MLLYILHTDKIYDYKLPNEISGKHIVTDFDKYGVKRNLVNVESRENKWYILGNNNIKIMHNGSIVDFVELTEYNFYTLTILGTEIVLLYAMPSFDDSFSMRGLIDNTTYTIGGSPQSDIKYNFGVNNDILKISYINNQLSYEVLDLNLPVYVNKEIVKKGFLNNFDTIFIMGLKIIICYDSILINQPKMIPLTLNENKFTVRKHDLIAENKQNDVRTYTDFYEDKDYYYKSPVFKSKIKPISMTISDPPSSESANKNSLVLTVIPTLVMAVTSLYSTFTTIMKFRRGESNSEELITSLIMAAGLAFTGIIWPFIENSYSNMIIKRNNKQIEKKYKKYLNEKDLLLKEEVRNQKMILSTSELSFKDCEKVIQGRNPELFYREIDDPDFLKVRLGIGNVKLNCEISYNKPEYNDKETELYDIIDKMLKNNEYIPEAPYSISLSKNFKVAFILEDRSLYNSYMNGIILQLLTMHSYNDLKIVVFTSSENSEVSYLKDTNHCWNDNHTFRYYATNLEEGQQVSTTLERELKQRLASKSGSIQEDVKKYSPFYLIISNSMSIYRSLNIIDDVLELNSNIGFGLLIYDTKMGNIPNGITEFVNILKTEGTRFSTNVDRKNLELFTPEFITNENVNVDKCSRLISNIPIKKVSSKVSNIPDSVGFLQMFSVGNVEQLNLQARWANSNPSKSLSVPLGVDGNGNLVNLDLHEKAHGPHGLIAGMTGSGKSELIVTYILSLALNFRPDEVQFVLIDYKGGGLAGAFENRKTGIKLPHLIGTITNLDKAEMKRTLVSINSELKRRQRKFNEAKETLNCGNVDIYKYQKLHRDGVIKDTLSHLFIICDEFAELKAQEPDFMDELISAARIGRSLGIHLILATQKPSGVVDDQIWSNSKFKICCKVQTSEDSNEMIKKPDAAYLTQAGSFYLQVGYDEYFVQGQSAYTGFPYVPTNLIATKIDNDIVFVGNNGEAYKTIVYKDEMVEKKEDLGEELTNILQYIINEAKKEDFKYQQLWLDNIPKVIYYNDIVNKYQIKPDQFDINPLIGEYDDPKNQKQSFVKLPITTSGNTFIVGSNGSGKSTLLSTIIYSTITTHNCNEVNIYILDCGTEKLRKFSQAPQVGEVLTIADADKIKYLFYMLNAEKNKRQKYYSQNNGEFLRDVKNKKCPFPNILIFIYDIDIFKEVYGDIYDEMFASFTRNCTKFGIYFIVSGSLNGSLGYMVENNFPQKIMLNVIDQSDYSYFFDHPPIPSKNPGRGIVQLEEPFEFQVPLIFPENEEEEKLKYLLEQLNKIMPNKAPKVSTVPQSVSINDMLKYCSDLTSVPLGINTMTAQVEYYNFDKTISLITSEKYENAFKFISSISNLLTIYSNTKIIVLNSDKESTFSFNDKVIKHDSGFRKITALLKENIEKYNTTPEDKQFIIVILGYAKLQDHLKKLREEDPSVVTIDDLILSTKNTRFKYILFDESKIFEKLKNSELFNYVDPNDGIWVGTGFSNQFFIETNSRDDDVRVDNNMIVTKTDGRSNFIKYFK